MKLQGLSGLYNSTLKNCQHNAFCKLIYSPITLLLELIKKASVRSNYYLLFSANYNLLKRLRKYLYINRTKLYSIAEDLKNVIIKLFNNYKDYKEELVSSITILFYKLDFQESG